MDTTETIAKSEGLVNEVQAYDLVEKKKMAEKTAGEFESSVTDLQNGLLSQGFDECIDYKNELEMLRAQEAERIQMEIEQNGLKEDRLSETEMVAENNTQKFLKDLDKTEYSVQMLRGSRARILDSVKMRREEAGRRLQAESATEGEQVLYRVLTDRLNHIDSAAALADTKGMELDASRAQIKETLLRNS